jgi:hypothetical protein
MSPGSRPMTTLVKRTPVVESAGGRRTAGQQIGMKGGRIDSCQQLHT